MQEEKIINLCKCGCGQQAILGKEYAWGHKPKQGLECACGCGQLTTPGRKFVWGHNGRMSTHDKRVYKSCPVCQKEFWHFESTPTTHCSSKCYGISKKGKPLTEVQIQGYKDRKVSIWNKGLTKETSEKVRVLLSEARKGENNPCYGKQTSEETKRLISEKMKHPKSLETRRKMSEWAATRTQLGQNNSLKHIKRGYVKLDRLGMTLYYSSSYELKALLMLDSYLNVMNVSVGTIRIPYIQSDGSSHNYIPDILATDENGHSYIIEIKPKSKMNDEINQLKFAAGIKYAAKHNFTYLIWNESVLFNKNGVTTEPLQEIVRATAAIPSSRGIMIQSELHSDMERQAEMTCPPIGEENE